MSQDFFYFLNQKETILVVTLNGALKAAAADKMQACLEEIKGLKPKNIVLNFSNLTDLDNRGIREVAQIRLALREDVSVFAVCGLKPHLLKMLTESAALRTEEVAPDLLSALQRILAYNKGST